MDNGLIRILMLEDVPVDAELTQRELKKGGVLFTSRRVDTREAFLEELENFSPQLVLADYSLPTFDGISALKLVREKYPDLPFIFVSGVMGEEVAIETLKSGATDYVLKHRLARLVPSVLRALKETEEKSERIRAEEALRKSEERYALASQGANDGLWDWDLLANEVYFSPRWKSMLGYKEEEVGRNPDEWLARVHPSDVTKLKVAISAHTGGSTGDFQSDYRIAHKDGIYRWMLARGLAVRGADGKAYRMVGSQTDITDRKLAEEQLRHGAFHDALTGLPNRTLFVDRLAFLMRRAKREPNYLLAALFLNIDRFKVVNDSLGYGGGNELLTAVSHRLEGCLRLGDTLARLGADEFTILLDDVEGANDAVQVAEQIQRELARPFDIHGQEIYVTASIGIALGKGSYNQPEDLLRDADIAMYRAKTLGRARYELFDVTMNAGGAALLRLEAELRRAVERKEFRLFYQPIFSLKDNAVAGAEALIRWQHPQRGLVMPMDFVPFAEETGLIVTVGEWVLEAACAQAKIWQNTGYSKLFLAVNFSPRQFQDQNLLELVRKTLEKTALSPRSLEIEVTEGAAMRDVNFSLATLNALSKMGIQIAIDDFGTGYSSLGYLKRFPIHTVKIDRSFVKDIRGVSDDAALAKVIIAMGHSLKLNVVAEGVETQDQLAFLKAHECDQAQGYLLGMPMPSEELTKLLMKQEKLQ